MQVGRASSARRVAEPWGTGRPVLRRPFWSPGGIDGLFALAGARAAGFVNMFRCGVSRRPARELLLGLHSGR